MKWEGKDVSLFEVKGRKGSNNLGKVRKGEIERKRKEGLVKRKWKDKENNFLERKNGNWTGKRKQKREKLFH